MSRERRCKCLGLAPVRALVRWHATVCAISRCCHLRQRRRCSGWRPTLRPRPASRRCCTRAWRRKTLPRASLMASAPPMEGPLLCPGVPPSPKALPFAPPTESKGVLVFTYSLQGISRVLIKEVWRSDLVPRLLLALTSRRCCLSSQQCRHGSEVGGSCSASDLMGRWCRPLHGPVLLAAILECLVPRCDIATFCKDCTFLAARMLSWGHWDAVKVWAVRAGVAEGAHEACRGAAGAGGGAGDCQEGGQDRGALQPHASQPSLPTTVTWQHAVESCTILLHSSTS